MGNLKDKCIKIVKDDRFLVATMPSGEVIPMQIGMIISNGIENKKEVLVEITLKAVISLDEFEIANKIQLDNTSH